MKFFILLSFVSLIICSPPPIPEPVYEPLVIKDTLPQRENYEYSSMKNLEENPSKQITEINKEERNYLENGYSVEHEIKMSNLNLQNDYRFRYYQVSFKKIEGQSFELISNSCQVSKISGDNPRDPNCISGLLTDEKYYNITFNYSLYNDEYLIVKYNYKIVKEKKDILYRKEAINIPKDDNGATCDFKFIIPESYTNLGLKNNILDKESENIFIFNKECPNEIKQDVIRFTPKISYWKAEIGFYLESSSPIDKNLTITFPRFYKGGKIRNNNYQIITYENKLLEESALIHDEIFLKAELPGKNNKEIGLNIFTSFSNNLNEEFNLYTESVYELDTNVDTTIKTKAEELINGITSVSEKFYKIGAFVNSHITYD